MARYLISEAARLTDVEAHVLRYWEEELELEIPRNELGHRYYTEEHIAIFNHIKEMKVRGFQLRAIRDSLGTFMNQGEPYDSVASERTSYENEETYFLQEIEEEETGEELEPRSEAGCAGMSEDTFLRESDPVLTAVSRQDKMMEFENIVYDIVTEALRNNNERLGHEVSERVNDKVVKEMNYLMRENEDRMEEHFRKLDDALVRRGRKKGFWGAKKEAAATKAPCSPVVSQSKRKRRLFARKRKTTIY